MTDGQWAPKSDFLGFTKSNSRSQSCGRSSEVVASSSDVVRSFGGSGRNGHLTSETTAYQNNTHR